MLCCSHSSCWLQPTSFNIAYRFLKNAPAASAWRLSLLEEHCEEINTCSSDQTTNLSVLQTSIGKHFHHPWSYRRVQDSWWHRAWCYCHLPSKQWLFCCWYAKDFAFVFHELPLTVGFTKSKHILKNWPFPWMGKGSASAVTLFPVQVGRATPPSAEERNYTPPHLVLLPNTNIQKLIM